VQEIATFAAEYPGKNASRTAQKLALYSRGKGVLTGKQKFNLYPYQFTVQ
jgi:hypothetical protein